MKIIKLNLKGILGIITLCMASLLVGVAYADEPIKTTYQTHYKISNLMVNGRMGQNGSQPHLTNSGMIKRML